MATSRHVLIVDDDAVVRRIVGSTLARAGFLAVYATDGEGAWRELHRQTFDLVITDRSMPRLDGHELVRRIRASAEYATLPVIMLSGSTDEEGGDIIIEGTNAFLSKGLSAGELLTTVERVMREAKASGATS